MVRVLSDEDVAELLELEALLDVIADAFRKQRDGEVERPERPHFPVGTGLAQDPEAAMGTALAMPAYVHGDDHYATKLASVHPGNPDVDMPTVQAQVAVSEAATGRPAAYMAGTRITNARTGCIGGLAARELADSPVRLGILGAGTQARWQARAIAAATEVEWIRIHSPSDSKYECADDLAGELGVETEAVERPDEAVEEADVVVTATTARSPVFRGADLAPGTLVIAIGAYTPDTQEIDGTTVERAGRIYADVPEEVARIGDVPDLEAEDLVPFGDAFDAPAVDAEEDDVVIVESVGSATLDAATAEYLVGEMGDGVGTEVDL
ncbi:ornithine cyclodeaminase [Halobacteriales archaeon QS_8_69_26]|nr:MAG: ornithine cyclodeaminase [Halobacteriales archaeon QS_8_69_26]